MLFQRKEDDGDRRARGDRDDPGAGTCGNPGCAICSSVAFYPSFGPDSRFWLKRKGAAISWDTEDQTPEKSPLPEREADMPILAWKVARLVWSAKDGFRFRGVWAKGAKYGADATAQCVRDDSYATLFGSWLAATGTPAWLSTLTPHAVPGIDCRCGFYAMSALPDDEHANDMLMLSVELFGRVIVCEHGYRAERQRVLGAAAKPCVFCGEPSTVFGVPPMSQDDVICTPRCDDHIAANEVRVTFETAAKTLGCPVRVG